MVSEKPEDGAVPDLSRYVRRLLTRSGLQLSEISGTGPAGTVTNSDVILAIAQASGANAVQGISATNGVPAGASTNGAHGGLAPEVEATPPVELNGGENGGGGGNWPSEPVEPPDHAPTAVDAVAPDVPPPNSAPPGIAAPAPPPPGGAGTSRREATRPAVVPDDPGPPKVAPEQSEPGSSTDPDHTSLTQTDGAAADENGNKSMSRQDELNQLIAGVRRAIPELNGVMIASVDGLAIADDFPQQESERIAAMAATALGLGKRISERTNLGGLMEAVVRGDSGYLVVYAAGDQAVLVLSGPAGSNLGLMRIEARAASAQISQLIK